MTTSREMPRRDFTLEAHARGRRYAEVTYDGPGIIDMIDTFDRPAKETVKYGGYTDVRAYANDCENKPGKRIPKAGLYVGVGLFHAHAECSIFDFDLKGPNAGIGAEASLSRGAKAFAKAELASASYGAGPLKAKAGLSVDTGVEIGPSGFEAKILGTGFTIGRKISFSFLGNGVEFTVW